MSFFWLLLALSVEAGKARVVKYQDPKAITLPASALRSVNGRVRTRAFFLAVGDKLFTMESTMAAEY